VMGLRWRRPRRASRPFQGCPQPKHATRAGVAWFCAGGRSGAAMVANRAARGRVLLGGGERSMMRDYYIEQGLPEAVTPACQVRESLRGQKALVTGASSGSGREIALALGRAGADVVVNYSRHAEEAEQVVEAI